jgi:hypothetical protein
MMNEINQQIKGDNNNQNIFINPSPAIDFIPQDIEYLLDYIVETNFEKFEKNPIIIPDLEKKNKLNGINENQFKIILEDVPLFDDIETCIREDINNSLKKKYYSAARILNIQYMNSYQKEFPAFMVQIVKAFNDNTTFDNDKIYKLTVLMHYMYHECDLGIKP